MHLGFADVGLDLIYHREKDWALKWLSLEMHVYAWLGRARLHCNPTTNVFIVFLQLVNPLF